MRVKVCGLTNKDDLSRVSYYGASAVGFIFYKKSPRYTSPSRTRKLVDELPPFVTPVGVFVDSSERAIHDICRFTNIKTIQLHGDETPALCARLTRSYNVIKSFRVDKFFDPKAVEKYKTVSAYLFDAYVEGEPGGTGETFNWDLIKNEKFSKPVILSGGLNSENVQEAVKTIKPFAIDVSSGLEQSPGIKDPRKIRAFFDALNSSEELL
ncbi:MAG: phosphoribosylanthranilate isomerase [Lysobacterales bacterium]|jgi:phosphoribosylanthranilate isomerase